MRKTEDNGEGRKQEGKIRKGIPEKNRFLGRCPCPVSDEPEKKRTKKLGSTREADRTDKAPGTGQPERTTGTARGRRPGNNFTFVVRLPVLGT